MRKSWWFQNSLGNCLHVDFDIFFNRMGEVVRQDDSNDEDVLLASTTSGDERPRPQPEQAQEGAEVLCKGTYLVDQIY